MELKTFMDKDFDPKEWINKAWNSCDNQDKEVFVSTAVSRLQLYMKQLTNSLDETTTQIVTSLPHVLRDAASLRAGGDALALRLRALEGAARRVEDDTGQSIASLQRIDVLKCKLEDAATSLREADKWTELAAALDDALDSGAPGDLERLAAFTEMVASMTSSLEVLSEAPDFEQKALQKETLFNRVEAAAAPPLMDALAQRDVDRAARYVSLFAAMRRAGRARRVHAACAAAAAAAAWRGEGEAWRGEGEAGRGEGAAGGLAALRDAVAADPQRELEWLTDVLKSDNPMDDLLKMYTEVLNSLDPSPAKVLSAQLKLSPSPEVALATLQDARVCLDELARTLCAPRGGKDSVSAATLNALGRALYAPLRELLPRWGELQTRALLARLEEPALQQTSDLQELTRAYRELAERCPGWLRAALAAAGALGGAAARGQLVPALEAFLAGAGARLAGAARALERALPAAAGGARCGLFAAGAGLARAAAAVRAAAALQVEHETSDTPLGPIEPFLADPAADRSSEMSLKSGEISLKSAASLQRAAAALSALAAAALAKPLTEQLDKIPSLPVWAENDALAADLPDYALSPQEYITEVGQYLMTLPQHLEMHLQEQAAWQYLSETCNYACELFAEKVLKIPNMDALGSRRCLTDIAYLSSVVEDLGGVTTPALKNLEKALKESAPAS